jgi:hypothetical protein
MNDNVDRSIIWGKPDRPENRLAIIDVDIPSDGKTEETQRLLTMDQSDHIRTPLPPQSQQLAPPRTIKSLLTEPGPDEAEDKEDNPEIVEQRIDDGHNN